eukprot:3508243-Pleurochrysis_carterae.AAC.5
MSGWSLAGLQSVDQAHMRVHPTNAIFHLDEQVFNAGLKPKRASAYKGKAHTPSYCDLVHTCMSNVQQ